MKSVLLLLTLLALVSACGGNDSEQPSPTLTATPTLRPFEIRKLCEDRAEATGDAIEVRGWDESDEYVRFAQVVVEVGDPFGVPRELAGSLLLGPRLGLDFERGSPAFEFRDIYARVTQHSPWGNDDAREVYEAEYMRCGEEFGSVFEGPPGPRRISLLSLRGPETFEIIECVTAAVFAAEKRFGGDSVGYTEAYRSYVLNRTAGDNLLDLPIHEGVYKEVSGRSPFISQDAMTDFRERGRGCFE